MDPEFPDTVPEHLRDSTGALVGKTVFVTGGTGFLGSHLVEGLLDAGAASVIEDLLVRLKEQCTLIVVSHYLDQVSRIADNALRLEACGFSQV